MKISELSQRTGISVASIKYYLREGLMPPGVSAASNQADYTDEHVRRLRLVRALLDIGELPVAGVRGVLAAVDDDSTSIHDAFGAVMHGLGVPPPAPQTNELSTALADVNQWLRRRKWTIKPSSPARHTLAQLIVTLRQFDFPASMTDFDAAADAAEQSAQFEVAWALGQPDRTAAVETMLIGTVVHERVLAEVRRLALEAVSVRLHKVMHRPRRR